MSFESDPVYKLIKAISLPLIVRHDRSIYQQENHNIDLALIFRRVLVAGFIGYWAGKFMRNR